MRWALFKVCVAVTTMVALAFLIPLGLMVRDSARERAFTAAERQAATVGPALAITTDQNALRRALASTQDGAAGLIAIHLPGGGASGGTGFLTVGTERAGDGAVVAAAANGRSGTVGVRGGFAYLEPVAVSDGRVAVVEVYIPDAELTRGVTTAWLVLSGVAVVLVLISVAVADRLGTRIVGSARRLANAARALGGGDLAVRVPQADDNPPELREAAEAFNTMADRVVRLLAAERELAADLSHRLRTPLTVLRLNAASLGQGVAADATRHAVAQLEREVDQIIRAVRGRGVEQASGATAEPMTCDAAEVIRDRAEFWSALAEDEGRPWQLAGAERPVLVPVAAAELGAALDAMLGNVFRHTEQGTAFAIDVHETGDGVIVLVSDAGPGIADPESAVRRGVGAEREGSTGLGLDIVRRVAEGTGGDVAIGRSVLGGTELRVRLLQRPTPPPRPRRRVRATR
ncbi:sensor histidine kinase [Streptacidiphilus rugosus]|uniref:sensor histidine kinase n=1 Tax=Streptacidiphilus rugosus TaxID=405783 RepID=UPI000561F13C|nr:HAMP domain-containing sensor histidine kinase [Streptacidiphilus rugosus]